MTLSHHVKDSRLKCAAFAGDACTCFIKKHEKSDRRYHSEAVFPAHACAAVAMNSSNFT
jgi:hypothetical protein